MMTARRTRGAREGSLIPLERDPERRPRRDCRRWLLRISLGRDAGTGRYRRVNRVFHGTKADAREALRALLRQHDQGAPIPAGRETVGQWLTEALDRAVHLGPQTVHRARAAFNRYLPASLQALRLRDLTRQHLEQLYADLLAQGKAPGTIHHLHRELRARLSAAVAAGRLAVNPASRIKLPRAQHVERVTLDRDQLRRLLDGTAEDRLAALWAVLALGGLRPEETLALRWSDLEEGTVRVRRALVWLPKSAPTFEPTKGKRGRAVPLPPQAVRALARHRARQAAERLAAGEAYRADDLVFASEVGEPLRWTSCARRFQHDLARLALPRIRPYDLRHTHATLLLEAGVPAKVVQERLGHAAIGITLDVYSHVTATMQEDAVAKLRAIAGE